VMGSLEGDRVVFCGSSMMAQWRQWAEEEERGSPQGGVPSFKGGGRRRRGGGNRWAGKRWQRSHGRGQGGGGGCCLKAVSAVQMQSACASDRETDTRGPRGFFIIPELSKLAQL
jgi:hypothetical protein